MEAPEKRPVQGVVKPVVVCLCGSTRFGEAFRAANLEETLAGRIVLSIGCDMRSDAEIFADKTPEELNQIKASLDTLHLHKIDMADEVLILNVGGYVGDSTRRELLCAIKNGKKIRYLEPESQTLAALKLAYRKHHLSDESIGWDELSNVMLYALCEELGDAGFQQWLESV